MTIKPRSRRFSNAHCTAYADHNRLPMLHPVRWSSLRLLPDARHHAYTQASHRQHRLFRHVQPELVAPPAPSRLFFRRGFARCPHLTSSQTTTHTAPLMQSWRRCCKSAVGRRIAGLSTHRCFVRDARWRCAPEWTTLSFRFKANRCCCFTQAHTVDPDDECYVVHLQNRIQNAAAR